MTYTHKEEHDGPNWVPDPSWDIKMEEANPDWCTFHDAWRDGRCKTRGCK